MAALQKLSRLIKRPVFLLNEVSQNKHCNVARMCTIVQNNTKPTKGLLKVCLIGAGFGVAVASGYAAYSSNKKLKESFLDGTTEEIKLLKYKPAFRVSRQVICPEDTSGLKLTLFQFQSCPFCCKVRAVLDYYGISYDIVEVNSVFRKELEWSQYKKVPILLTKVQGGYQPLNDSSMIVSLIASHLQEQKDIEQLAQFYPTINMLDEKERLTKDIMNKYFLMFGNGIPKNRTMNDIVEERKWRKWADDVLVHDLSPNVYRTLNEAYETFDWFAKVGRWDENFSKWERFMMINVGAIAMYMIARNLKKKYNLKDDVRQSLYDDVNRWLKEIKARGTPFMGGQNPDLADLAVYGILKSMEGCSAFQDLKQNTKVETWYNQVTEKIEQHAGSALLQ